MVKKKNFTFKLTPEAHDILQKTADDNGLKMSQVLEMLIRGNKGVKFAMKGSK